MTCIGETLSELPLELEPEKDIASVAIISLPWPHDEKSIPKTKGFVSQAIPLFNPDSPPPLKRYLLTVEAPGQPLPSTLTIEPSRTFTPLDPSAPPVEIFPVTEGEAPYFHREDTARIHLAERAVGLRLGLECDGGISWWQWTRAERLWSGPVSDAWRVGGHIPTHVVKKPPIASDPPLHGLDVFDAMEQFGGDQIAADVFLIIFHCGILQVTAHFKNNFFHVPPKEVPGLPVVALTNLKGEFAEQTLAGNDDPGRGVTTHRYVINRGQEDQLDLTDCLSFFDRHHPGLLWPLPKEQGLAFRPFGGIDIVTHKTADNRFIYLGRPKQKSFPAGVSRSIRFRLGISGRSPLVARYQVPAEWHALCGTFNGRAQAAAQGKVHQWAAVSRDAIYNNTAVGGFDTGRVWRYLRRDLRSGKAERDDAEWEGGTARALMLDASRQPRSANWNLILHQVYHYADIAVHHGYSMVRCHGYNTMHAPLPMMRIGGLVFGYLETGDPYLLETARGVADTFMRMDTSNQPRYSIGRDIYPLAGLMTLYDYTSEKRFLDFGRELAQRLLATQTNAGGFSGQGGAGAMTGATNRWYEKDISFGNGLLAPIGLLEWALRDSRHPEGLREQMQKWVELVLTLQSDSGTWPRQEAGSSYTLIPAGLLFSLSACHRLWGEIRGIQALERYIDYALTHKDFLLGTHSFLAVLYASFYEMERAGVEEARTASAVPRGASR